MRPFRPKPNAGAPPFLVAHRGVPSKAPENTLASFLLAFDHPKIDMIELDVHLSKEEEVIVLHDRTLQRTSTGNGAARGYAVEELKRFDAGSWFDVKFSSERIPTLGEVLTRARGVCWVNIELKSHLCYREPKGLLEHRVMESVRSNGMESAVMFSSFDHRLISSLKSLYPQASVGVLYNFYRDFGKLPSELARNANAEIFVCGKNELSNRMLRDAKANGIALYLYTVNSIADARAALELGVDGIISDNADEIIPLIEVQDRVTHR
jgi:glycerophosphoryl diester phosphodiesterase